MNTPPHVVAYRAVTVIVALLILLAFGFGAAGHGPLASLHNSVSPATRSLHLDRISG